MIEAAMFVALGFCTAGLISLAILPAFYRRAARLTEEALRAVNPASYAEVRASQDQERARHAIQLRRVERQVDSERAKAAKHHMLASRLTTEIEVIKKSRDAMASDFEAKLATITSDQKAVDLLSFEITVLKQKLTDAERALAENSTVPSKEDVSHTADDPISEDGAEWLPAKDTMALTTITGLEAEVATLKAKLSTYESSATIHFEAEQNETARTRLSKLEGQLVDTESKYISAQAEVTRLSLQLDSSGRQETDVQQNLTEQLEALTNENAKHQAQLQSKDRSIERLNGQVEKLQNDLILVPTLASLRGDFQQLVAKISHPERPPSQAAPVPKKQTSDAANTSLKPKKRTRRTTNNRKRKEQSAPPIAETKPASPKTSDIASAAEALVSRIVGTNRGGSDTSPNDKAPEDQATANGEKTAVPPQKSTTLKQKSKDVA